MADKRPEAGEAARAGPGAQDQHESAAEEGPRLRWAAVTQSLDSLPERYKTVLMTSLAFVICNMDKVRPTDPHPAPCVAMAALAGMGGRAAVTGGGACVCDAGGLVCVHAGEHERGHRAHEPPVLVERHHGRPGAELLLLGLCAQPNAGRLARSAPHGQVRPTPHPHLNIACAAQQRSELPV